MSNHADPVFIDVEKIVKKLLDDYKEDIAAFEEALDALTELTENIYRKAREQEETTQLELKHRQARNVVLKEIRKVTLGKELPAKIRTLVLKVWPSLMFNYYLNNGKANDEWVDMLMVLDKVIESVQPTVSFEDMEAQGFGCKYIVDVVREKLKRCHKSVNILAQVIEDLQSTYADLRERSDALDEKRSTSAESDELETCVEVTPAEDVGPEQDPMEQIVKDKLEKLPAAVQPGAWYVIYNGEDKPVRRLKLAVILVDEAILVFVDHLGNVVIEKDAEVFTKELENGLSGLIMQHSVFDHALSAALDSIKK